MYRRKVLATAGALCCGGTAGCTNLRASGLPENWPTGPFADYETVRITVQDDDGGRLGVIKAAIARTAEQQYRGLSPAETLPENAGLLFVFADPNVPAFVMREMDFGLDIVFADADGAITTIHHAPAPDANASGTNHGYEGRGPYVLELNRGWTTEHTVTTGDQLVFDQSALAD